MRKYIVVVRDFNPWHSQPSDDYLRFYDKYYVSPIPRAGSAKCL